MRVYTGLCLDHDKGVKVYLDDYEDHSRHCLLPKLHMYNRTDVHAQRALADDAHPIHPAAMTNIAPSMVEKYGNVGAEIEAILNGEVEMSFVNLVSAAVSPLIAGKIGFGNDAKFKLEVITNATHDHPSKDIKKDVLFVFDSKLKVKSIKCKVLFMFNSELIADTVDVASYICIYGDLLQVHTLNANYGAIAVSKYDIENLCHTNLTLYSPKPLSQRNESNTPANLTTEIINLVAGQAPDDIDELMSAFTAFVDMLQAVCYDRNESVLFPAAYYDPETDEVDNLEDVSELPELVEITPSKEHSRLGSVNVAVE